MKITDQQLKALIYHFQAGDSSLAADGIYGPNTALAIDEYMRETEMFNELSPAKQLERYKAMQAAWVKALECVGQQEEPLGSNAGPFVNMLRTFTKLPRKGGGEWCAVLHSATCMSAGINIKSRGAPGLVRALSRLPGARTVRPEELREGMIGLALKRRGTSSHHVQMFKVFSDDGELGITHVGGNENHRVKCSNWSVETFTKDSLKLVIYGDSGE